MSVEVTVNGESLVVRAGGSLVDLLDLVGSDPRTVAIEHNGGIVKRDRFADTVVRQGDRVEIVHFVQGG